MARHAEYTTLAALRTQAMPQRDKGRHSNSNTTNTSSSNNNITDRRVIMATAARAASSLQALPATVVMAGIPRSDHSISKATKASNQPGYWVPQAAPGRLQVAARVAVAEEGAAPRCARSHPATQQPLKHHDPLGQGTHLLAMGMPMECTQAVCA